MAVRVCQGDSLRVAGHFERLIRLLSAETARGQASSTV
jgi:hypothetical protein